MWYPSPLSHSSRTNQYPNHYSGNVLYSQWREGHSLLRPLLDLLPFVALAGGTYRLVAEQHSLLIDSPLLTMGAVGCIFVEQVCALMLAHMTHTRFRLSHRTLLLPFLLFVLLATTDMGALHKGTLDVMWRAHVAVTAAYTLLFLLLIVADLARVLGVRPFRVTPPSAAKRGVNGDKVKRR